MGLASIISLPMTGKKWLVVGMAFLIAIIGAFFYGNHKGKLESEVAIAEFETKLSKVQADLEKEKGNIKEKIVIQWKTREVQVEVAAKDATEIAAKTDDKIILSKQWACIYNNFVGDRDVNECYEK